MILLDRDVSLDLIEQLEAIKGVLDDILAAITQAPEDDTEPET